jgi:PAS domain S-box-containing protein
MTKSARRASKRAGANDRQRTVRKRTSLKANAFYEELFASSPDGILLIDAETQRVVEFNDAACRQLGYTREEFAGLRISDYEASETPEEIAARVHKVLREGKDEFDTVQRTKTGQIRHVHVWTKTCDLGGRVVFYAIFCDITERKEAEEEIRDLSKFPSENPSPVLRIARDGTLLYINEAGLNLLPQWHLEVGHASLPRLREAVFQSIDNGTTQELDLEHGDRMYSFFVAPIVAARYANLYGRDITEHKQAEEALRKSESSYRTLFEQSPDAVVVLDPETTLPVDFNDEACRRLGYSREEFARLRIADYEVDHTPAEIQASIREILATGTAAFEVRHRTKQGDVRNVWISVRVLENEGQTVCYSISRDITERKRAEKRKQLFSQEIIAAREAERKQVSSDLHHDVGSLTVGMSAYLDAIEGDLRSGKPKEALKWMKRARKQFDHSVGRLRGLAIQLRPPELDVLGLGAALRQHFAQVTKHRGARIYFRETLGRRRVPGNTATTLFRLAQEALTNAIKHGHAKRVDVDLSATKDDISLTVRDNGKGFNPPERLAPETSRMGLRVMQEMAAFAGGVFEIHSARGRGTTVRVTLPLATAASEPGAVT